MPNPDSNNLSEQTPEENRPPRRWVWHSTENSIAAGQISILAIVETLLAMLAYIGFAFYLNAQWWLLITAVVAPILLLRSPQSEVLGVCWLQSYWGQHDRKWSDLSIFEKSLCAGIPFLVVTVMISWLASLWLPGSNDWDLFWRTFLLGVFALLALFSLILMLIPSWGVAGVFAVVSTFVITVVVAISTEWSEKSLIITCIGFLAGAYIGPVVFVLLVKPKVTLVPNHRRGVALDILFIIWLLPFFTVAVWGRSLFIRAAVTLRHPFWGIRSLANNFMETIWCKDLCHYPELLPGAKQVSGIFSVSSLIKVLISERSEKNHTWWTFLLFTAAWYVPALLYRWSLKATLWLWWPLALLLRQIRQGSDLTIHRKNVRHTGMFSNALLFVALLSLGWLGTHYFTNQWFVDLLGDNAKLLLEQLKTFSIPGELWRAVLLVWSTLVVLIWGYAKYVKEQRDSLYQGIEALEKLPEAGKVVLKTMAARLDRLYTVLVVMTILVGYSVILTLANHYYPQELYQLLPLVESWKAWL